MSDTKNLAIFLALGIGVYFLMVRNSRAGSSMARYNMGPNSGPYDDSYLPTRRVQPTNSNYVDLAASALNAWSQWTGGSSAATPAYVPDFSAANAGPTQQFADLNNWMEP